MKKYTPEERKEILKNLKQQLGNEEVEFLGYNRYSIKESYQVQLDDVSITWLHKYKLFDEDGNIIPLSKEYNGIFSFTMGVAVVCIRQNPGIIEKETGRKHTQERKDGLIDVDGKELLPCIYDSISVKLDGFIEIIKDGQKKATYVGEIIGGKFNWEVANDWD